MNIHPMKMFPREDRAFRVAFIFLVATAGVVLFEQCSRRVADPSRIEWPASSTTKP
jgi:hypothetical protein